MASAWNEEPEDNANELEFNENDELGNEDLLGLAGDDDGEEDDDEEQEEEDLEGDLDIELSPE